MTTKGLDPAWVATSMSRAGRRADAEFVEFIGTGQMSRNARFALSWPDDDGPSSVVVKVPSSESTTRATAFERGTYAKECAFYRSVHSLVDVVAPVAHAVDYDASAQDFALVLDDLVGSEQGDHFTEPTVDQLAAAVDQLAALQAPVWGATDGPEFAEYRAATIDEQAVLLQMLVQMSLPTVFDRLGAGLDDEVVAFLERYADLVPAWTHRALIRRTLVHGDYRPDNFMFGVAPDAPPLAIVDWQTLSLGAGPADLAYLLGGSLTTQRRHAIEDELVVEYVRALGARGVDYHVDDCREDYAVGALHGVLIAVAAATMADVTERGDALFTLMLNRHVAHALELGSPGLLAG